MKKILVLVMVFSGLVGCANQKTTPPVSGELQPINTIEVMNNASAR